MIGRLSSIISGTMPQKLSKMLYSRQSIPSPQSLNTRPLRPKMRKMGIKAPAGGIIFVERIHNSESLVLRVHTQAVAGMQTSSNSAITRMGDVTTQPLA